MKDEVIRHAIAHHVDGLRLPEGTAGAILQKAKEEKPMKRRISLVVAAVIVLVLAAATALAVTALRGLGFVGRELDGSVYSGATDGQRLYYSDGFSLLAWRPEDETPQVLISSEAWRQAGLSTPGTRLVHTGDALLLVDTEAQKLWRWTGADLLPVLDYADTPLGALAQSVQSLLWQEGALYLVCGNTASGMVRLVRADIADGSAQDLGLEGYTRLAPYQNGLLLGIRSTDGGNQAVILDAATGEVEETLGAPADLRGICWSEERDAFFAMVDGALARWDGTDWQPIRACALPTAISFRSVIGDWYVAAGVDGIRLIALDGKEEAWTSLTVRGLPSLERNLDHSFQQAYPGMVLSRRTETGHFCARDAVEAIRAGDTTDLFYLRLDGELLGLLRDGFFPAVASDSLLAEAEGMAPVFRDALVWEGQLLAYAGAPVVWAWQIVEGADDPPATFAELAASHRMPWTREEYARYLLVQLLMEEGGLPSEVLAPALKALKAADLPLDAPAGDGGGLETAYGLVLRGHDPADPEPATRPVPRPSVSAAAPQRVPAELRVYVLNPNSKNREAALAFLEHAAGTRSPTHAALLSPESAVPALYPELVQLAETTGANADHPANYEVSQEGIDLYRSQVLPWLDLQLHPLLCESQAHDGAFQALVDAVMTYLAGESTLESCLSTLGAA